MRRQTDWAIVWPVAGAAVAFSVVYVVALAGGVAVEDVLMRSTGALLATGLTNLFTASPNSGPSWLGNRGENGLGQVVSDFFESANVDLGAEMTAMVQAQRAYQLNLKAVQTLDEMTAQALQLRRYSPPEKESDSG